MGELVKGVKITQEVGYDTVLEYSVVELPIRSKVVKNQTIKEILDDFCFLVVAIYTEDLEGDLVKVWEQILESEDDEDLSKEEVSTQDTKDSVDTVTQTKQKGKLSGGRVRITRLNRKDVNFDATLKSFSHSCYSIEDSEIERYNDTLIYRETHPDFGENGIDYYGLVLYS